MDAFRCEDCSLTVEKDGEGYRFTTKPGVVVVPTKLAVVNTLKEAYETGVCPLCGYQMAKDLGNLESQAHPIPADLFDGLGSVFPIP